MKKLLSILIILCLVSNVAIAGESNDKSPVLGCIMEGIIPGSGHAYYGEWGEAAVTTFCVPLFYAGLAGYYGLLVNRDFDAIPGIIGFPIWGVYYYVNIRNVIDIADNYTNDYNMMSNLRLTTSKLGYGTFCGMGSVLFTFLTGEEAALYISLPFLTAWGVYQQGERIGDEEGSLLLAVLGSSIAAGLSYAVGLLDSTRNESFQWLASYASTSALGALIGYNISRKDPNPGNKEQEVNSPSLGVFPMITPKYSGIMVAKRF